MKWRCPECGSIRLNVVVEFDVPDELLAEAA